VPRVGPAGTRICIPWLMDGTVVGIGGVALHGLELIHKVRRT